MIPVAEMTVDISRAVKERVAIQLEISLDSATVGNLAAEYLRTLYVFGSKPRDAEYRAECNLMQHLQRLLHR